MEEHNVAKRPKKAEGGGAGEEGNGMKAGEEGRTAGGTRGIRHGREMGKGDDDCVRRRTRPATGDAGDGYVDATTPPAPQRGKRSLSRNLASEAQGRACTGAKGEGDDERGRGRGDEAGGDGRGPRKRVRGWVERRGEVRRRGGEKAKRALGRAAVEAAALQEAGVWRAAADVARWQRDHFVLERVAREVEGGVEGGDAERAVALAGVDAVDIDGRPALHWAVRWRKARTVRSLIGAGADVNTVDKEGRTPLHAAVDEGGEHLIRLLVGAGADVNVADKQGRTALHSAVIRHTTSMMQMQIYAVVQVLIGAGA